MNDGKIRFFTNFIFFLLFWKQIFIFSKVTTSKSFSSRITQTELHTLDVPQKGDIVAAGEMIDIHGREEGGTKRNRTKRNGIHKSTKEIVWIHIQMSQSKNIFQLCLWIHNFPSRLDMVYEGCDSRMCYKREHDFSINRQTTGVHPFSIRLSLTTHHGYISLNSYNRLRLWQRRYKMPPTTTTECWLWWWRHPTVVCIMVILRYIPIRLPSHWLFRQMKLLLVIIKYNISSLFPQRFPLLSMIPMAAAFTQKTSFPLTSSSSSSSSSASPTIIFSFSISSAALNMNPTKQNKIIW